jgi:crotonobetainyl-CoA:carnitine CoA-transferase CaiB-like acyl-CoA transferase
MFVQLPCPAAEQGRLTVSNSPFRFSRTSPEVVEGAPELGQHTEEVLSSLLGMSHEEIASLKAQGVLSPGEPEP